MGPGGSPEDCAWCGQHLAPETFRCGNCGVVVPTGEYEKEVLNLAKRIGPERLTSVELKVALSLDLPSLRHFVRKGIVGESPYSGHVWLPRRFIGHTFVLIVFDPAPEPEELIPRYDPED